ncbi:hypothetical protein CR513_46343, partial [Mucuna pruriens]
MAATAYKTKGCLNKSAAIAIILGFTKQLKGDLNIFKERTTSQLANLRCPTMSDHRWYKDAFL